jgi:hypothetical protein
MYWNEVRPDASRARACGNRSPIAHPPDFAEMLPMCP